MRGLWRWTKRLVVLLVTGVIGLLAPVAYTETMCRPSGDDVAYTAQISPEHHRAETRTLMTYPEWHIVHAYEDYGQVLKTGDPHDYGFFEAIRGYWASLCRLSRESGPLGEVDGATKQLVYVIGVSFTAELLFKAAYEETVGRLFVALRGEGRTALDDLSAQQAADYAAFLQQVPWYKWDFPADAAALSAANTGGLRNQERDLALGLEYRAKSAYAKVIENAVSQVGPDALTLRMIVQGDGLDAFEDVVVMGDKETGLEIETIRYRALTHLLSDMARAKVDFIEIAGNDDIMFTAISDNAIEEGAIFSAPRQGFTSHRHLFLVKVTALAERLRGLDNSGLRLEHIHDY